MRIAQVVPTFPPYMAGTGNVCYHNSLELARLGHDVTVFTSRFPDHACEYPSSIKVVRSRPLLRIGNAPLVPGLAAMPAFDIVHLHYPYIFGAELVYLNSLLRRSPLVVTCHQDLIFGGCLGPAVSAYKAIAGNVVLSRARRILAPSLDYLASSWFKRHMDRKGISAMELPNGVDVARFHPGVDSSALRDKLHLQDQKVVLFVGALDRAHYFKGVDVLMRAFRQLGTASAALVVVGDGDLRAEYQRQAAEFGVSEKVIFAGRVAEEMLPQYYALCDALVLPSTTSGEAFGLVLVEAMACGKPVTASNLPGVRTVVDDGVNGFLVAPGDADALSGTMRRLLDDPGLRRAFGAQGRKKTEAKYDWRRIGEKLDGIYRDLLDEEGR